MTTTASRVQGGIGESAIRPDGIPKLKGNFAYISDLVADRMLWGATLRSPYAHARLTKLDVSPALAMPGVVAAITQDDVPGNPRFGQEQQDQPVLCDGVARYWGEPVAVVAADDPETARLATKAILVEWEELEPVVDPLDAAEESDSVYRAIRIRRGDPEASGPIVVEGRYETATQDQAPLGPEAGLAIPDGSGGIDLYATTQWVHVDHRQIVECLGTDPSEVRCHPAGIGGAFGAREDISLHIHLCLLASVTGRPVKMVYNRSESFVGHVKRHPSTMTYRHEIDDEGRLVKVSARLVLDGGAYAHTSNAVIANAAFFAVGPYECENVEVDALVVRTNNPPTGAMRGFGVVQTCFAHESQMDKIADAIEVSPLEIRRRNALERGGRLATSGQVIEGSLPTNRVIDELEAIPLPTARNDDVRHLPGGTGQTTEATDVRRGVGYALSIKNLAFSEGFDDYAEARVVLNPAGVEIHTAAMEVGQGLVTVCQQIARSVLGIPKVAVVFDDTSMIGSAGSTSASRQTQMTGGAVHAAAQQLLKSILEDQGGDELRPDGVYSSGERIATIEDLCGDGHLEQWVRFSHPPTFEVDENGQGEPHAGFAIAAHRAVVDVDPELGLVRVVSIDTAQDVGRLLNPAAAVGQLEGGIMQGMGLAVMEELVIRDGTILNPTFTDYLLPTFLDAPSVTTRFVEEPDHWGPFGAKGIGEPPTISSTPAVVAAIRNAVGKDLTRVPVRPQDIVGI